MCLWDSGHLSTITFQIESFVVEGKRVSFIHVKYVEKEDESVGSYSG